VLPFLTKNAFIMTCTLELQTLLKDSAYKLTQFSDVQIQALENSIIIKQVRDKATPYIVCLV